MNVWILLGRIWNWIRAHSTGIALVVTVAFIGLMALQYFADKPSIELPYPIGYDFRFSYQAAGQRVFNHETLYQFTAPVFYYAPQFAGLMVFLKDVPVSGVGIAVALFGIAYLLSMFIWKANIEFLLPKVNLQPYLWVAIMLADMIGTLLFGNIAGLLVLITGLAVRGVLKKNSWLAGTMMCLLLITKIYVLLLVIVFLVFSRDRKLIFRTVLVCTGLYIATDFLFIAIVGWDYGIQCLQGYFNILSKGRAIYTFTGVESMFDQTNNSLLQTGYRYRDLNDPLTDTVVPIIQVGSILFLMIYSWWELRRGISLTNQAIKVIILAFVAHLISFLPLPYIPELMHGGIFWVVIMAAATRDVKLISAMSTVYFLNLIPSLIGSKAGIPWLVIPLYYPSLLITIILLLVAFLYWRFYKLQGQLSAEDSVI